MNLRIEVRGSACDRCHYCYEPVYRLVSGSARFKGLKEGGTYCYHCFRQDPSPCVKCKKETDLHVIRVAEGGYEWKRMCAECIRVTASRA